MRFQKPAIFVALALGLLILMLRAAHGCVGVLPDGIEVVNILSWKKFAWAEVRGFTLGRRGSCRSLSGWACRRHHLPRRGSYGENPSLHARDLRWRDQ
jgi:hypothetical protein